MFTIGCNVPDIVVTSVKEYTEYVNNKFRAGTKRPLLTFESVSVYEGDNDDEQPSIDELLIKFPPGTIKQYITFENKLRSLINMRKLCSIEFCPTRGRVFRCKLSDVVDLANIDMTKLHDLSIRLLSCKCFKNKNKHASQSLLTWELVSFKVSDKQPDVSNVLNVLNALNVSNVFNSASDSDSDTESESSDNDVGPSPEELKEIRMDVVSRLQSEIESFATTVSKAEDKIKTYTVFLDFLQGSHPDGCILEMIQKANLMLDVDI